MPPIQTRFLLTLTKNGRQKITQQRTYIYQTPLIQEEEWQDVCSIEADYFFDRRNTSEQSTKKEES